MIPKQLFCYLLISALFVLFGCSSPNREIQPSQGNQSEQRAIRPVVQITSSEYRQALVIGNSDYDYAGVLRNPINDAQAISNTLGELGFKVRTVIDADKRGMEQAIRSFGKQLRDRKGVGLFYYAGHGMQLAGENYLLPVNINPDTEDDVLYDGVPLGRLLAQMKSAGNGINVVILDACRNNPFARSFRNTSRGLAQVVAPTGSFISYATAPGQIAADGSGENGLYTSKLLKHMVTPGVKLEEVFKRVRVDVQRESNSQQVPWDASSVTGDFYFVTSIASAPDPNKINLADLQKRANVEQATRLEQQRKRANWENWQQKMQQDYKRVLAFEKQSIGVDLKAESWQRFLDNWADDNPYSTQDAELRSGAQAKVSYWRKNQKVEQKPKDTSVVLGLQTAKNRLLKMKECSGCSLRYADLGSADLSNANLSNADLSNANLSNANLSNADLSDVYLRIADLGSADLGSANLGNADLRSANLSNANLSNANLSNADLDYANLGSADLRNTNLRNTNLRNTNLTKAKLNGADMSGAKFCNTTMPDGRINNRDC